MKAAVSIFINSMLFSLVVAIVYWLVAREYTGTVLLGIMALATGFFAGYVFLTEREANLESDNAQAPVSAGSGERVGTFVASSRWPPLLALSLLLVAAGSLVGVGVTIFGALALLLVLWALLLESR